MPIMLKKVCQVGGFLLLISLLFLALSVASYSFNDPTWNHYMSYRGGEIYNLGGMVGAALADLSLQALLMRRGGSMLSYQMTHTLSLNVLIYLQGQSFLP